MYQRYQLIPVILLALIGWLLPAQANAEEAESQNQLFETIRAPEQIDEQVVVRVLREPGVDIDALYAKYDVWTHGYHDQLDQYVVVRLTPEQYAEVYAAGYPLLLDVARTVQVRTVVEAMPGQRAGIPGFACYRTVEETHASMQTLAAAHPNLVQHLDIGDTWQKVTPGGNAGYDIQALIITNVNALVPQPKPRFLIMAATHAREYTTAETAMRFAEHLVDQYGSDPDITWLLDYYEIHIVPQANPDGRTIAESADIWRRKNTNPTNGCQVGNYGIDLNRNMSFQWVSGSSTCADTYPGPIATEGDERVLEPENQAIADYALSIYPDKRGPGLDDPAPDDTEGVFITIHSSGQWILPTWAWTTAMTAPNATEIFTLGRKMGYYTGYDVCGTGMAGCLGAAQGTHDDFVYGELGVPAYTYELGTQFHQSCSIFENTIYPDVLDSLIYTAKTVRRPYLTPAGPEVLNLQSALGNSAAVTVSHGTVVTLTATVDDTRYDSGSPSYGIEPMQVISAARYSIDAPSWITNTVLIAMQPQDGAFDELVEPVVASLDTTGWGTGHHVIYVEGQDADGNWGVPTAYFIEVEIDSPLPVAVRSKYQAADYTIQPAFLLVLLLVLGFMTVWVRVRPNRM